MSKQYRMEGWSFRTQIDGMFQSIIDQQYRIGLSDDL